MQNPQIVIRTAEQFVKTITTDKGAVKELIMQRAFFDRGDGASYPFDIMLGKTQAPYPAGRYTIAPESYLPDRFGVQLRLTPGELIEAVAKVKAA